MTHFLDIIPFPPTREEMEQMTGGKNSELVVKEPKKQTDAMTEEPDPAEQAPIFGSHLSGDAAAAVSGLTIVLLLGACLLSIRKIASIAQ